MASAVVDPSLLETSQSDRSLAVESRFSDLRGVRWRIDLGILPGLPSASIDELRRVTADTRRRLLYASMRRRLLIDPHLSKDGSSSPDLSIDNPLSQNPDSTWGRYFRNAELEKMVDQDLSRLYPEHGSYFQTPACQAMLRRILLMWCLRHPEYGYRQGMHELLAPLLYVLHVDVQHLFEVRKVYEDYFTDDFDEMSFPNGDLVSNYRFTRTANRDAGLENEIDSQGDRAKPCSLDDLDPDARDIFLLSDAYGAEGELGIVLSERFMEHDAYCMFDGLMSGGHGVVAMADFFSLSPAAGPSSSLPPVIEASSALYHLLSIVDSSLHSHLVELGVEPQYFALRWLRVLFGREFSLEDLLVIWDEIFSSSNGAVVELALDYSFKVLCSPRGAFISAMAVSMLLHLRSSLLATEYATACLQRLLHFPENVDVKKLIEKAKSLQGLALEANLSSSPSQESSNRNKLPSGRGYSLPAASSSPKTPLHLLPDSYWEDKWRVLHKDEALRTGTKSRPLSKGTVKGMLVKRLGLARTESDPSPAMSLSDNNDARSSVRRSLVSDFAKEVNLKPDLGEVKRNRDFDISGSKESISMVVDEEKNFTEDANHVVIEDACLSGENSVCSPVTSPHRLHDEHENASDRSSVTSNSFVADNDDSHEIHHLDESSSKSVNDSSENPLPRDSEDSETMCTRNLVADGDKIEKEDAALKDRKPLSGKFQWLWRFSKGSNEGNCEKGAIEGQQSSVNGNISKTIAGSTTSDGRAEVADKKMMSTLKNLGQSMLENIQVIESVFQQDRGQAGTLENLSNNILVGKGQATAMTALKELRKISNLLSEM
ncbi:putative Rab-GTPase-TBC domain-containing protein [Dioscorea sansibarensis]